MEESTNDDSNPQGKMTLRGKNDAKATKSTDRKTQGTLTRIQRRNTLKYSMIKKRKQTKNRQL
jgi:hypothetical protein